MHIKRRLRQRITTTHFLSFSLLKRIFGPLHRALVLSLISYPTSFTNIRQICMSLPRVDQHLVIRVNTIWVWAVCAPEASVWVIYIFIIDVAAVLLNYMILIDFVCCTNLLQHLLLFGRWRGLLHDPLCLIQSSWYRMCGNEWGYEGVIWGYEGAQLPLFELDAMWTPLFQSAANSASHSEGVT